MKTILAIFLSIACGISHAQVLAPAVNATVANCANGSDVIATGSTLGCASGTPTMGSCGTGSPSVSGTDYSGAISAGTGVLTACTLNFSKTLSATPKCIVSTSLGAAWITALSTTVMTVTAASLTSGTIWYKCWGFS